MIQFSDPRLQDAMKRCGPVIEGYEGRLNAVSTDIKNLEAYLADEVMECVVLDLACVISFPDLSEWDEPNAGDSVEGDFERLVLQTYKGRWRLMYVKSKAEGDVGTQTREPEWLMETAVDRRPLIEAPLEVRLRAHKVLPEFLATVARRFASDPNEVVLEQVVDYGNIPF